MTVTKLLLSYANLFAVGPSSDPSGVSMVDSIKVYTKTKEAFGWPDDATEQTHGPTTESLPEQPGIPVTQEKPGSKTCSKTERYDVYLPFAIIQFTFSPNPL